MWVTKYNLDVNGLKSVEFGMQEEQSILDNSEVQVLENDQFDEEEI